MSEKKRTVSKATEKKQAAKPKAGASATDKPEPKKRLKATVTLPPRYSSLNVRSEPNGEIVGKLKDGCTVNMLNTVAVNGEEWVQIGKKQFVNRFYLKI